MKIPARFRKPKKAKPVSRKAVTKGRTTLLKASAKAASSRDAVEEYDDEPTMKLGTAVIVVLVLHVVAVGGVYAFNTIKAERLRQQERAAEFAPDPVSTLSAIENSQTEPRGLSGDKVHRVEAGETLAGIAREFGVTLSELEKANGLEGVSLLRVGQEIRIPDTQDVEERAPEAPVAKAPSKPKPSVPVPSNTAARDSGEIYTVVKGDNPVAIARKFRVSYNDLMQINNIEDPRLLQIGQKLKIPAKH